MKLTLISTLFTFTLILSACGTEYDEQVGPSNIDGKEELGTPQMGNECIEICHVPPGNPDNAHTICVNENAVDAHIGRHGGDFFGQCDQCDLPDFITDSDNVDQDCVNDCQQECTDHTMAGAHDVKKNFHECLEVCLPCVDPDVH